MKRLLLILIIGASISSVTFAGGGFWDSFSILNVKGAGNTFYDLGAATVLTDFHGYSIGEMTPASHSLILGGQIKTWKNNGTDITGASIFYRIYPQGSPSGSFTAISYTWQKNYPDVGSSSGDQQWGTDAQGGNATDDGVNILENSTLTTGTYTLEVYAKITTNGVDAATELLDNNSGNYYNASFTVNESLPVTLTSFSAEAENGSVLLTWQTATELNNYGFEIERSLSDATDWQKIGFVPGSGN
ncbi:MAG: hypothetical protein KKG93_02785, partial [Bacteroidetes bacterium]|nr:hypothetical protein [Bacteroidota bacterium]